MKNKYSKVQLARLTSKRCLVTLVCSLCTVLTFAQNISFDEFKRQKESEFDAFQRQRQEEFARFLQQSWEEFELMVGDKKPLLPEPVEPRIAPPMTDKESTTKIAVEPKNDDREDNTELPDLKKPSLDQADKYAPLEVQFYGHRLGMEYDKSLKSKLAGVKERHVGQYWSLLNATHHQPMVYYLRAVKDALNLNDWAYYQLVKSIAHSMYDASMSNEQVLFTAFIMSETGYDVRFGLVGDRLIMMLATKEAVYNTPFFRLGDKKYYTPDAKDKERIRTYSEKGYSKGKRLLSLAMEKPLLLADSSDSKQINARVFGHLCEVNYNRYAVDFYATMPATTLDVYFNTPASVQLQQSLTTVLKKHVEGKTEREAVNTLLHFVHYAFDYKTDREQFGYERCFFPDEIFAFPYSDCEDRSVIFARLVRHLLRLPVVGISYPGHVATAVQFAETFEGDYVEKDGARYMVCDATYYGAVAGQSMPEYKKEQVSLIEVR